MHVARPGRSLVIEIGQCPQLELLRLGTGRSSQSTQLDEPLGGLRDAARGFRSVERVVDAQGGELVGRAVPARAAHEQADGQVVDLRDGVDPCQGDHVGDV